MEEENILREGPKDPSLLTFQQHHRSHALWENRGDRPLDCSTVQVRRVEASLKRMAAPAGPVAALIRQAGFGGLIDLPFISVDYALVTALLERWRPETHTFHFLSGESTVSLQDVEVLVGLPVDGPAVIGHTATVVELEAKCVDLLGLAPGNAGKNGARLRLRWLRTHFTGQLPDDYTEVDVQRQARGYIMQLLGGMVVPDQSGCLVHGSYLYLLEDLTVVRSWGSACLAALYHYLCIGAMQGTKDLGGPMFLLQLWAWERLPFLAPTRVGLRFRPADSPLGARWGDAFTYPDLPTHVLPSYRHAFDIQESDEVVWTPYSEELIESLPPTCRAGRAIWMAKVPLICFPYVEEHMPDRVMRQFGFRQHQPDDCNCGSGNVHGNDFKTKPRNVVHAYANFIARWNNRLAAVVPPGEPDLAGAYPASDPYVQWYERIIIRHTTRLGAAADIGMRLFAGLSTVGDDIDVHAIRRTGQEGMACMRFFHKWLRKTPPVQPQPPHEAPGNDDGVHEMDAEPQAGDHPVQMDMEEQQAEGEAHAERGGSLGGEERQGGGLDGAGEVGVADTEHQAQSKGQGEGEGGGVVSQVESHGHVEVADRFVVPIFEEDHDELVVDGREGGRCGGDGDGSREEDLTELPDKESGEGSVVVIKIDDSDDDMPSRKRGLSNDVSEEVQQIKKKLPVELVDITASSDSSDKVDGSSSGSDSDIKSEIARLCSKVAETWEFKADMIVALDREPELCMNAVCALYRKQLFYQFDAFRGNKLGNYLTDGPQGKLKRSVSELQKFDPNGLGECKKLALRHSDRLFEIYQKKQDAFFPPS